MSIPFGTDLSGRFTRDTYDTMRLL
jgi:hypothetical protein